MNMLLFKLLMTLLIEVCKYLRRHYKSMTPEQRLEWNRQRSIDWVEDFQTTESGGTGEGIVLENAIDPYVGDGKVSE